MHFIKNHKTSLEAEEMQLIRPTSEFKVGHLPFQGKVKGIFPAGAGQNLPYRRERLCNCDVLSLDFSEYFALAREKSANFSPSNTKTP